MNTSTSFDLNMLISIASALIIILTFRMNEKKNSDKEAEHRGRMNEKLDYIFKGVSDIRDDNKSINSSLFEIFERLALAEQIIKINEKAIEDIKRNK